jgi:hypothetical protein
MSSRRRYELGQQNVHSCARGVVPLPITGLCCNVFRDRIINVVKHAPP